MKIPIFPGKYHQNGGFSMAMLVSGRVDQSHLKLHGYTCAQIRFRWFQRLGVTNSFRGPGWEEKSPITVLLIQDDISLKSTQNFIPALPTVGPMVFIVFSRDSWGL